MKAVVLVGGEGTRLRPLTETIPKPLIPVIDRPFLDHLLTHLAAHGVDEVLLSSPYLEASFAAYVRGHRGDPPITWVIEDTPLGTGGAVVHAARRLEEAFLVLNGDILTDLDLSSLVRAHREAGAVATIALAAVEDARPFGLVRMDGSNRILEFREKPTDPIPGLVNAGTYVLEPEALADLLPGRPLSIEREVFPSLIERGASVHGVAPDFYWMDLGTPEKYLRATFDVLDGRVAGLVYPAPFVDGTATVSLRASLGRWVVVGPDARLADEAVVEDSVLLRGATIARGARIRDSIVGPAAAVGEGAVVEASVLGEGAEVRAGEVSRGDRVRSGRPAPAPPPGSARDG